MVSCLFVPNWRPAGCWSQKLKMWSELAPLPFQSKVLSAQFASSVPAMSQLHSEGSTLLSSIYQAGFGRARCGFGTMSSSLGRPAEAIKHTDSLASTFASHINSFGSLPCYFIRVPAIMTGFRIKLSSVTKALEKQD